MPAKKRITRPAIVKTALEILRKEGYEKVNARSISRKLNCSTQPIYTEFRNMEELKAELIQEAEARYLEIAGKYREKSEYHPYMAFGLGFLRFAKEERQLFRYLYMRDRQGLGKSIDDANAFQIIRVMTEQYGIAKETAVRFHYDMAIYSYGLAVMLNTGYLDMDERELVNRLQTEFIALCGAYGLPNTRKD